MVKDFKDAFAVVNKEAGKIGSYTWRISGSIPLLAEGDKDVRTWVDYSIIYNEYRFVDITIRHHGKKVLLTGYYDVNEREHWISFYEDKRDPERPWNNPGKWVVTVKAPLKEDNIFLEGEQNLRDLVF